MNYRTKTQKLQFATDGPLMALLEKYYQPLHSILNERNTVNNELAWYLKEPGYE